MKSLGELTEIEELIKKIEARWGRNIEELDRDATKILEATITYIHYTYLEIAKKLRNSDYLSNKAWR